MDPVALLEYIQNQREARMNRVIPENETSSER
jgi:hypothetical protein